MAHDHLQTGIRRHSAWVGALIRYVEGDDRPAVDVQLDETQCDIGRWIDSISREYAAVDEFERLRAVHSAFHDCAKQIVARVDGGDPHGALQLMQPDGEFARLSLALVMAFDALDGQSASDDRTRSEMGSD